MLVVTKRDGKKEPFTVDKIRSVIEMACEGLEVNPLELESKFDEFLKPGITTESIQNNLIYHSRSLASPTTPDWNFVSGRLLTMHRWHTTCAYDVDFYTFLTDMMDSGLYNHKNLSRWSESEINVVGDAIVQDRDLNLSYAAMLNAERKYLMDGECMQQLFMVNAMILCTDNKDRIDDTIELYNVLSERKLSLATPWLSNLRRGDNINSCYVLDVEDDLNSIYDNIKNAALISQDGGGIGMHVGRIRAQGSSVRGRRGGSKGVVPFLRVMNDTMVYIDQCWHGDTLIYTENGPKRIKDLNQDDYVVVEDGSFRRVLRKKNYSQTAPMMKISTQYSIGNEIVTTQHPILAICEGRTGGDWVDSGKLKVGDFVGNAIPTDVTESTFTNDNLRFYGILLGVVEIDEYGVCYINYDLMGDDTIEFLENYMPTGDTTFEYSDLYNENGQKRISPKFLNIEPEKQLHIVKGMVESIGDISDDKVRFEHTSKELIFGLRYILLRNKTPVSGELVGDKWNVVIENTEQVCSVIDVSMTEKRDWYVKDGILWNRITSIESHDDIDEDVWDLAIQGVESYNTGMVIAHNGGKRPGAATTCLPIWHADIEAFLSLQTEGGDLRNKCFDIFPQVKVHDLFMKRVLSNGDWYTFCPHEVKHVIGEDLNEVYGTEFTKLYTKCCNALDSGRLTIGDKYKAKDLLKELMRTQVETGLPYIMFTDTVQRYNPNKHDVLDGKQLSIQSLNLCVESYSNTSPDKLTHACSLASVVVGRHDSLEDITNTAKLASRALNAGFNLFESPVQSAKNNADRYRTIGVGIMGLHDWLAKNGYRYNQLDHISDVAESIAYGAVMGSIENAMEFGSYPAFDGSMWDTGEQTTRFAKYGRLYDWEKVQKMIDEHGIYNGCVTMCAPTSSTSLLQDATAGIMPTYSAYYTEKNAAGSYAVSPENLRYNPLGYARTMPMYEQTELVDVVATVQKFMTSGISAEYIFDHNKEGFTAKDIYDMIVHAWKSETKSIYYIRSIKNGDSVDKLLGGESACVGCSG